MSPLLGITFFVLGAIIASFAGVAVSRIHTGQTFLTGRSRCDACNRILAPTMLVPIISFLSLKGRALCCGTRLSLLFPLSEALLGALFVLSYVKLGVTPALLFTLLALAFLSALVLYDLFHQVLPPPLLTLFLFASFGASLLQFSTRFLQVLLSASLIALSLWLLHFFSQGRLMGFADAPLALGLSLLVGPVAFSGFIFSFWIGALIGIVLLLMRPRGSRIGVEVPFAPFLAAGFLLAYFTQWNPFFFLMTLLAF